jgi:hypothetical protein
MRLRANTMGGAVRVAIGAGVLALVASGCAIARVSVSSTGIEGTKASTKILAVTDDGRYSLFVSDAANLVAGDTNGQPDVFRHDATTGATVRIDVATNGAPLTTGANDGAMSSDGRYAAFVTADPLDPADTNESADVYVRDLEDNVTRWASRAPGNTAFEGSVQNVPGGNAVTISADGRYVSFLWQSGDFPPVTKLYYRDFVGKTTLALTPGLSIAGMLSSRDETHYVFQTRCFQGGCMPGPLVFDPPPTNGSAPWPTLPFGSCGFAHVDAMSATGRFLVWNSMGGLPAPCLPKGLYLVDRTTAGATPLGTLAPSNGPNPPIPTSVAGVSRDGTAIVYVGDGSLLPGGTQGRADLYLRDLVQHADARLNLSTTGAESNGNIGTVVLSDVGHRIAFSSTADNLVDNDHNGVSDVFVRPIGLPASAP